MEACVNGFVDPYMNMEVLSSSPSGVVSKVQGLFVNFAYAKTKIYLFYSNPNISLGVLPVSSAIFATVSALRLLLPLSCLHKDE